MIHQDLHADAIRALNNLKSIIDSLKSLGPHPDDGHDALSNVAERLDGLRARIRIKQGPVRGVAS